MVIRALILALFATLSAGCGQYVVPPQNRPAESVAHDEAKMIGRIMAMARDSDSILVVLPGYQLQHRPGRGWESVPR